MVMGQIDNAETSQADSFASLARSIEADEDETRWEARLRKIAAHKPVDSPSPAERTDEA